MFLLDTQEEEEEEEEEGGLARPRPASEED
jgi:hypothetical protein